MMQYTQFGSTGLKVSRLGIGSIGVGPSAEQQAEVIRIMNILLDAGANLVDTAQCYPRSEELIGRELSHRRSEYILVTKCGHHEILPDGSMRSRAISMEDIDTALKKLRTDYLDVMLLHSYDYEPLRRGEALEVLSRAKDAGKIRFMGYSGDNERAEWAVKEGGIDVLETSVSIADQHNIARTLPACIERGVGVIAKKPIANAAWRLIDTPEQASEHIRPYVDRLAALAYDPGRYDCADMAELALRFTLGVEGVHSAIASSKNPAHIDENLRVVERGGLKPEHVEAIARRFSAVQQGWQGCN
jgi:aryl-alcohol dehydrogenase-like predicted oxidoreductase